MSVIASPVEVPIQFPAGTEIVRVEYALGHLEVFIEDLADDLADRHPARVLFPDVAGFRVLDERDLLEYWPSCSMPNGWLFRITAGGWLS